MPKSYKLNHGTYRIEYVQIQVESVPPTQGDDAKVIQGDRYGKQNK